MRLSMIRAGIVAIAATLALAACSGSSMMPGMGAPSAPTTQAQAPNDTAVSHDSSDDSDAAPDTSVPDSTSKPGGITMGGAAVPALTTCATSPPQYWWLFKGACVKFTLTSSGASFSLAAYKNITVKGSIGKNTAKGSVTMYLADAIDSGDVTTWKGKTFPKYAGKGKTFIYASAVNQSTQIIKPVIVKGKPVLQYIITDSAGIPGKTCAAAVLTTTQSNKFIWASLPGTFQVKGKTVTISQYSVPKGFELPPKTPLYFAVNCFS